MNFQTFEKTDRKILSGATVTLVLATLLLWQDGWIYRIVQTDHSDLEMIGEVTQAENDVRRRFEVALSWLPLDNKNKIFQGDSIFTGNKSSVTIETKTGEQITIAANSLVVISKKRDSISLDIGFGSVEGKVERGKKLLITSNNKLAELNGDNARVKIDAGEGNNLVFNVLAGELKVKSGNDEKLLRKDDTGELKDQVEVIDVTKPNIQLTFPLADQKFKFTEDKPIVFQWKTPRKFTRMKIKISTDPEFKNVIQDSRIDSDSFSSYGLPKDTKLYWQIIAEGGVSKVQTFDVVGEQAPTPIYPKPGFQFFYDPAQTATKAGADVELRWQPGSISSHYEIQISDSPQFSRVIESHKTKEKALPVHNLPQGEYYWRVRSVDFADAQWSSPSTFKVGLEPKQILASPVPVLVGNVFYLPTKSVTPPAQNLSSLLGVRAQPFIEAFPILKWSPVANSEKYVVQVSTNKAFTNLVVNQTIKKTFFKWKPTDIGQYYWRVRGSDERYKDALFMPTQTIKIGVRAPLSLSQSLVVDEVPDPILLKSSPPPFKLNWGPTVYSQLYEVQLSRTSSFEQPQVFITKKSSQEFEVDAPGIYYWRVRSLDRTQLPISPFSANFSYEYQRVFKDPSKSSRLLAVYPRQQDSIILVGKSVSEIEFKWSKPYSNATYRIELSYTPDFQHVFYSDETTKNYLTYKKLFSERVVYWRVRAETKKFVTDWTGANRFLVTYEELPFSFEDSDVLFEARLKAKDQQLQMIAAQRRRLMQMRTPASTLELQLDTPQFSENISSVALNSNFDPSFDKTRLIDLALNKYSTQISNAPTFKWEKVVAAERYVFEVAHDREFNKVIVKAPCWDPFFTWEGIRPGKFYYRVQAFNDRYNRSKFSASQELQVVVTSPITTNIDNFVEAFAEPKELWPPPSAFTLSWSPVVFARKYEVEFSEDRTFSFSKIFKTRALSHEFRVSKAGLFFWRVRPVNDYGIGVGPFSETRSVEIVQTNRRPASVNGLAGFYPTDRTMVFVGSGQMKLPFLWAAAEDNAKLEISTSADFQSVLLQVEAKNGQAIVSDNLPSGKIFWRLKSQGQTSPVYEFILRREIAPYSPEAKASAVH